MEGSLTQAGMSRPIFVRAYAGGSARSQAHAFANDIARELRQTAPIFQTKIAFRLTRGSQTEVAVSDYDGYNLIVLTHDNALVEAPSWVPGRRGLLYTSWMNGNTEIYEHNLATGSRRVFAGYPGANFSAEASPNGERVAMILSKNGSPNLYVCDIDGGGLQTIDLHAGRRFIPVLVARQPGDLLCLPERTGGVAENQRRRRRGGLCMSAEFMET